MRDKYEDEEYNERGGPDVDNVPNPFIPAVAFPANFSHLSATLPRYSLSEILALYKMREGCKPEPEPLDVEKTIGSWKSLTHQLFLNQYVPAFNSPAHWFEFLRSLIIGGLGISDTRGM